MTAVLLVAHVLAAVVFVGPVTVAASIFPRYVRAAVERTAAPAPGQPDAATISAAAMHRLCRTYAVLAIAVPVFGLATAAALEVLTQAWVLVSVGLTVVAGLLLAVAVVPQQRQILRVLGRPPVAAVAVGRSVRRLAAATGVFNLTWAVVVVLMILRPGSTTGV